MFNKTKHIMNWIIFFVKYKSKMVLEKVYQCKITVDIKKDYLGYKKSREVAFKILPNKIICVEINDLKEEEEFGTVNKYHKPFLRAVMCRYPDCIYDVDDVMTEENEDGDQIFLDVTILFESQHPNIFPFVR